MRVLVAVLAALLVAGCTTVVFGRPVSTLYDPFRVGGLPAEDGPGGPRPGAPEPTGVVEDTDGSDLDRQVLLAVNDIEDFWRQTYSDSFEGTFIPVSELVSFDSTNPMGRPICGQSTYQLANAFYCREHNLLGWDRGVMVPLAQRYFGDMSINALMAHEYAHAVQRTAGLVNHSTLTLVVEQQADCLAGVYLRWVAEGHSPRFMLSTGDGLSHVLAGAIVMRDDPVLAMLDPRMIELGHGTALDRVSAIQTGFANDASTCAAIDMKEIEKRQGDLPEYPRVESDGDLHAAEIPVSNDTLTTLMGRLGQLLPLTRPPTLSLDPAKCSAEPAAYCPVSNTIAVDLPALQKMGAAADESDDESDLVLLQGGNTALSIVVSRYMLAFQQELGVPLVSAVTALRTACLTGVAQRKMVGSADHSDTTLVLGATDIDEAVAGLLTNGLVASDVTNSTVPAGFTRIVAFRSGLLGDVNLCFSRFR